MAIELKEYIGAEFINVHHAKEKNAGIHNLAESTNSTTYVDKNSIMVDIEGIHSQITRNNTYYSPNCLKESVKY